MSPPEQPQAPRLLDALIAARKPPPLPKTVVTNESPGDHSSVTTPLFGPEGYQDDPNKRMRLLSNDVEGEDDDDDELEKETESPPTTTVATTISPTTSSAEFNYQETTEGARWAVVLTMCIGLKPDDPTFCVLSDKDGLTIDKNYKDAPKKNSFKYSKNQCIAEVKRRYKLMSGGSGKISTSNWNLKQVLDWLVANPIKNEGDVAFLKKKEEELRSWLSKATGTDKTNVPSEDWRGSNPYLRLIHVLIDDEIKKQAAASLEYQNLEATDARNCDYKPPSYHQKVADLFNDEEFVAVTLALPELHNDFKDSLTIKIDTEGMPINVTAEKIKTVLGNIRPKLMTIISNWEKSGNGSGQRAENTKAFGRLVEGQKWKNTNTDYDQDEYMDGDNCACFLNGSPSWLLYAWHLWDAHDCLKTALNKLDDSVCANSDSVPDVGSAVTAKSSKRMREEKKKEEQEDRLIGQQEKIADSLGRISASALHQQLSEAEDKLLALAEELEGKPMSAFLYALKEKAFKKLEKRVESLQNAVEQQNI